MKWLNSHQVLLWLVITVIGGVAYIYTAFATVAYVNQYVDVRHESVKEMLQEIKQDSREIKTDLKEIRDELHKRGR